MTKPTTTKHRGGRPTSLTQQIIDDAWEYIDTYEQYGDAFPSVLGLCKVINRPKSTVYDWASVPGAEFSDILAKINECQAHVILNKSIKNDFNAAISKLVLGKHGYHDRTETDHTVNMQLQHKIGLDVSAEEAARLYKEMLG